jgi:hypothetical protein
MAAKISKNTKSGIWMGAASESNDPLRKRINSLFLFALQSFRVVVRREDFPTVPERGWPQPQRPATPSDARTFNGSGARGHAADGDRPRSTLVAALPRCVSLCSLLPIRVPDLIGGRSDSCQRGKDWWRPEDDGDTPAARPLLRTDKRMADRWSRGAVGPWGRAPGVLRAVLRTHERGINGLPAPVVEGQTRGRKPVFRPPPTPGAGLCRDCAGE